MQQTLIKMPVVMARTSMSKPYIYAQMKAGTFPKPVKTGIRSVAWVEADVAAWIDARIAGGVAK